MHAITVCVNFADLLAWSLPHNRRHFEGVTVVTTAEDRETLDLCAKFGARVVLSERVFAGGSRFDRGAAVNEGLDVLRREHPDAWVCLVDADMILPWNLREALATVPLDPSCIYGIERGVRSDEPINGFFQLFHASQPHRYREGHIDAGYTDTEFRDLWPRGKQITIPGLKAQHLCRHGVNWGGRVSPRIEPPTQVVTPDTLVEEAQRLLCGGGRVRLPEDWRRWPNIQAAYRGAMTKAVETMPPYPQGRYAGRGVVMLGGAANTSRRRT